MAKTLVIKGASFGTNKVTKVSFAGNVPCTGITMDETISITGYDPVAIEYTLTPANTTDTLLWASSDTDVVTVANGVLTAVGIGTATITATCGNQTATATVTVAISCNPAYALLYIGKSDATPYNYSSNNSADRRVACYGAGSEAGTYMSIAASSGENIPVIKIPKNTKSITFAFSNVERLVTSDDEIAWWFKDESAQASNPNAAILIEKGAWYIGYTYPTKTINVPDGADSFLYSFMVSAVQSGETAADLAEAVGLTITYNTTTV